MTEHWAGLAGTWPWPWLLEGGLQLLKGRFSLLHFLSLLLPFLLLGFDLFLKAAALVDGLYLGVRGKVRGVVSVSAVPGGCFPRDPFWLGLSLTALESHSHLSS